jgi:two-component system nitrogen regulation response regulator NtrX
MQHQWPGNVRELKNFIERLVIMTRSQVIDVKDIPAPLGPRKDEEDHKELFSCPTLREARYEFEKRFIQRKLVEHGNNVSQTAEAIGVERSHLHRKIRSFGIEEQSEFRSE